MPSRHSSCFEECFVIALELILLLFSFGVKLI